tara:strand:+ start:341 stop:961 length:621 start_codon:yes stop_codon:yes gene_type:complete
MGFNIKDYTLVKDRLVAFRDEFPLSSITTELISVSNIVDSPTGDYANEYVVKATVIPNPLQEPEVCYTGLAAERDNTGFVNKSSAIENCETSAVGRALAFAGFGGDVQFASAEELVNAKTAQSKSALTGDLLEVMDNLFKVAVPHLTEEQQKTYRERRSSGYYDTKVKWRKTVDGFITLSKPQKPKPIDNKEVKKVGKAKRKKDAK